MNFHMVLLLLYFYSGCTLTVRDGNGVFMIPSGALPANKKE